MIGVSSEDRAPLVAEALARLGAAHALVLHAAVGMDEVSPSGATQVWEVRDGQGRDAGTIAPDALGLDVRRPGRPGGRRAGGERRPDRAAARRARGATVERCAVLLNAAAALYVSGNGWTLEEAVARAREALEQRGRGGGAGAAAGARRRGSVSA